MSRGDPPRHPRVAAEGEPALGALVAWPPVVPEALRVEIARDDRLFVLVDDAEMQAQAASRSLGLSKQDILRAVEERLRVRLEKAAEPERCAASIPGPGVGRTVEYFPSAADRSGRREALPRGAPVGFYSFSIGSPADLVND